MAHLYAIKVGNIHIINHGQLQAQVFAFPRRRYVNGFSIPYKAIKIAIPHLVYFLRLSQRLPLCHIILWLCPQGGAIDLHTAFFLAHSVHPLAQLALIFGFVLGSRQFVVGYFFYRGAEVGQRLQRLAAYPGFYIGATPASHNQSHGHIALLVQVLAKEIACGRKLLHGFGRTHFPRVGLLGQAIGGRAANSVVNMHEAYVFILPRARRSVSRRLSRRDRS